MIPVHVEAERNTNGAVENNRGDNQVLNLDIYRQEILKFDENLKELRGSL